MPELKLKLKARIVKAVQFVSLYPLILLAIPSTLNGQTSSTLQQEVQQATKGAQSAPTAAGSPGPTLAPEGVASMRLIPGSLVSVSVFEETDLNGTFRLDSSGNVAVPLAGVVHLKSLTLREAETAISNALITNQILKQAHVTVNIEEYGAKEIVVLGEVASSGRFPALAPRKLVDVLAMAGGRTPTAGNEVIIHRSGAPSNVTELVHYGRNEDSRIAPDVEIEPGDTVFVKKAGVVYILGSVNRPGGYLMQEAGKLNIFQALALAFGTAPEASTNSIRVLRKMSDGTLSELLVPYNKVSKGTVPALALQSEDIIYVPSSKIKSLLINGKGVLASAAAATVYTTF